MKKRLALLALILLCAAVFLHVSFRGRSSDQPKVKSESPEKPEQLGAAEKPVAELAQVAATLPKAEVTPASPSAPATSKPQTAPSEPQKFHALTAPSDPAEARLLIRQVNGQTLGNRYAAMFDELGFTPEQRQQFIDLRLDWMERNTSLYRAAIAADPTLRDKSLLRLVSETVADATAADYQAALVKILGEETSRAINEFEEMAPVRQLTNQVERQFQSTASPLTVAQATQLTQLIAIHSRRSSGTIDFATLDTAALATEARSFLNPGQVDALIQFAADRKRRATEAKMPETKMRG